MGQSTLSFFSISEAVRRRFSLRLFVAFIAVAVVPVAILEVVVRRFVADRLHRESADQARERAAVAKKAVEDFAFFQRGESPGREPVTDAALVWASSLIRNDLDVFDRGRLLASSKRELYASGLLLPRAAGSVYRSLILDGLPTVLRPERIGSFSTLVVSVPVKLGGLEPGLLSIPLALRQREEEAALEELDRTIRLGTFAFLVVAALLGHSMARRISDPIRDLTRATRRIAEGDLGARVSTRSRDELRDLVDSFNHMAGDLERQRGDLERSNRLAAWAEMARQVAHEVKNPLTPIQLSAEHLRRVFKDPGVDFPATLTACTDTILKQVRTLRRIVTEFSAFARPPVPAREPQDLGEIVSEAVAPYRAVLPPGVRLALELSPGLPPVQGDRRLLERAVLNLLENALQAVGERGTIDVRTRAVDGRLEVEVEDSGPGLEPEIRDRIFEPFFSTKTGGSGLGLALVQKTAQDHGGGVRLDSPVGGRTRAVLWLPAEQARPR
jgi:signal transduction histidine kinase